MRALISGASGLIGSALSSQLLRSGWQVTPLTRNAGNGEGSIAWNPYVEPKFACEFSRLEDFDAVIHLAGAGIAESRWSASRKCELRDSRVTGTRNLISILGELRRPPKAFLCASAIGLYGNRGEEVLTEQSAPGSGFLAEVCQEWEAATQDPRVAGMRVVNLRFGIVLSAAGGALAKMLPPFRIGLGGRLGSGKQYMSWIARADAVRAIEHALGSDIRGPLNVTAPNAVTNEEFTRVLARVLHRPAILPVPEFALRLLTGELLETILASARVMPERLAASGFKFRYGNLREALEAIVAGKSEDGDT